MVLLSEIEMKRVKLPSISKVTKEGKVKSEMDFGIKRSWKIRKSILYMLI